MSSQGFPDKKKGCLAPSQAGGWSAEYLQVHVPQLGDIGPDDLVRVHEDDLAQREREQHVQEQDLVCPDDALLLRLQAVQRALQSLQHFDAVGVQAAESLYC